MARRYEMTWQASTRRWFKKHRGKMYTVSCRQLGAPESKEGSAPAANAWWDARLKVIEAVPPSEDDRVARATAISRLVRDFSRLDDDARKEAVEALLGAGSYDSLKTQRDAMLATLEAPSPDRTVEAQAEAWKSLLRAACRSGQISEGRFDAYCRKIRPFVDWIGPRSPVDAIDEGRLEGFYSFLSGKVAARNYSPTFAHELLMTAKQFISRLAELRLIPLPGNIRSRRFRFNHSAPAEIEVFTVREVRDLLARAPERMRLYLLCMINCGFYQFDLAELRNDEIDWEAGTVTRSRSKTRERGGPKVTYKLWPETLELLKEYRSEGDLAITTERGNPLVSYQLVDGKLKRYDSVQSGWQRMGKARLGMKHLRKTSATILGTHPHYKYFAGHFLADSPKGMDQKHYVRPNDAEFFEALDWLRRQILGAE